MVEPADGQRAGKRVKGVLAIAQDIDVRYPEDKKTADDEIAARALNILRWSAVVPVGAIMVKVQGGWISLSGEVAWQYQRAAAESEVRLLGGVKGVFNNITIKSRVQPDDIKRRIEDALKRNAEVEAHNIRVHVESGGRVSLEGQVHGWREREVVENAAWSVPGVVRVDDRLTLVS